MFLTLQKIKRDSEDALREGDFLKVKTLRLFLSAFHNREIELRPKKQELAEEDVYSVLKTEIKKRKEAIEMFEKGKREDLVSQEKKELEILKKYLPAQISDEELKTVVERV